jgi:hypothetical protein
MRHFWWRRRHPRPAPRTRRARAESVSLHLLHLESRCLPAASVLGGFNGLDFNASGGAEPPDTEVAAGPAFVVETVNSTVAFYNKATGAQVFQQGLASFFAPLGKVNFADLTDSLVTYDDLAGRFLVSTLEQSDRTRTSALDLAVSKDSDPTHGFCLVYRIDLKETRFPTSFWGDFPKVGWNADAWVYTVNMFAFPSTRGQFDHVQVVSIDKNALLGSTPQLQEFRADRSGSSDFALAPAVMHGAAPGSPMWLIEENQDNHNLRVVRMTNELSNNPSFNDSVVGVPSYANVSPPLQPNGTAITTNLDTGVLNAAWRNDELVASQNVGRGGLTVARWYQFSLANDNPSFVQSGDEDRGAGVYTFFPAVDLNPAGDIGFSFIESSRQEFMSMYVTGRSPSDPNGTLAPAILVHAGQANYKGHRAGDYSGTSVDPADGSFWSANEYSNNERTNWGTWIAHYTLGGSSSGGGSPFPIFALGGAPGRVQIRRVGDGSLLADFAPYGSQYNGPVTVAVGDVNHDGFPDVVTGAGVGNPNVRVFDGRAIETGAFNPNNPTASMLANFFAYGLNFNVGVNVAVGDVNGDGFADIVTGASVGNPHVKVFSGKDIANGTFNPNGSSVLAQWFAYALQFNIGVHVAVGDVSKNGFADIVTGAAAGNPDVRVYSGQDIANGTFNPNGSSLLAQWFAYGLQFNIGANVAVGDVNGDGFADIITGATAGNPQVKVYDGQAIANGTFRGTSADAFLLGEFYAYQLGLNIGATVAAGDFEGTGHLDILTGTTGGAPHYRAVRGQASGVQPPAVAGIDAIASDLAGGVFVGA